MSDWPATVQELVARRALHRCEYCLMHQRLQVATFHIEHVIPASAGGTDDASNLALACPSCSLHKSNRTSAIEPNAQTHVPLFNPRAQDWRDHFQWIGYQLKAKTVVGSATIALLRLNHDRRIEVRIVEELFGLFPPASRD
jgi:hypothetical protein